MTSDTTKVKENAEVNDPHLNHYRRQHHHCPPNQPALRNSNAQKWKASAPRAQTEQRRFDETHPKPDRTGFANKIDTHG